MRRFLGERCAVFMVGAILAAGVCAVAWGQAKPVDSLDDQLLKEPAGGAVERPGRAVAAPWQSQGDADAKARAELQQRLDRELDSAAREGGSPMLDLASRMHDAGRLLGRGNGSRLTQNLQDEIVGELDRMIREARQPSPKDHPRPGAKQPKEPTLPGDQPPKTPDGGTGGTPTDKPPTDGSQGNASQTPRRLDPQQMQAVLKKVWGALPERARQQVQQLPAEQFMPKYEVLIEDYYRRLSEEGRPAADAGR